MKLMFKLFPLIVYLNTLLGCQPNDYASLEQVSNLDYRNIRYCEVTYVDTLSRESVFNIEKTSDIKELVDILNKSYITEWDSTPAKYGREAYHMDFHTRNDGIHRMTVLKTIYGYPIIQSYDVYIIRNDQILSFLEKYH